MGHLTSARSFMRFKLTVTMALAGVLALRGGPEVTNPRVRAEPGGPAPTSRAQTEGTQWTLTVEPNAAVTVSHRGAPVIQMDYMFWGANWAWAGGGRRFQVKSRSGDALTVSGQVPGLKIDV